MERFVFLKLTFLSLCACKIMAAPMYPSRADTAAMHAILLADEGFQTDQEVEFGHHRHKRGAADEMFALINGIFAKADTDSNNQLDLDEYWNTFQDFDLNENREITSGEYVSFMTSGGFPAMRMLGSRRNVAKVANRMFRTGDMDRNGVLDRKDAEIIFSNLDKNGDEHISRMEYAARWQTILARIGLLG